MTDDQVTQWAYEAGSRFHDAPFGDFYAFDADDGSLMRFAALVAAHERERCAKLADIGAITGKTPAIRSAFKYFANNTIRALKD